MARQPRDHTGELELRVIVHRPPALGNTQPLAPHLLWCMVYKRSGSWRLHRQERLL